MLKLRFAGPSERPADPANQPLSDVHVWFNRQGGIVARGFRDAAASWMAWPSLATYRFSPGDPFITAYALPGAPTDVIWDIYRRTVLPMALQVLGWEALHASAVVTHSGLVAFSAVSETGKSTVAFGLRRRGFPQWSDDGVVFQVSDHAVAQPLPFQARLRPGSLAIFGSEGNSQAGVEENSTGEQRYDAPLPIAAICLLTRTTQERPPVSITRVAAPRAFTSLLTHAHEFDPNDAERRGRMMQTYLDLVATVQVYEVSFVPDREHIDQLLDAIVEGVGLELPAALPAGQAP